MRTTLLMVLATGLLIAVPAQAQIGHLAHSLDVKEAKASIEPTKADPKLTDMLLENLNSDNEGVVEGTLRLITRIKLENPDWQFRALHKKVDQIRQTGPTRAQRYMAYLTLAALQDPYWFKQLAPTEDPTDFWLGLGQRAHDRLVADGVVK